ncbi:unnamed protein product [Zymoseptoria tritici ST99CH_3D7]|uniref:Uncharacterized protein n=1 Tax=Zymoseptoria tritici (strain ST99CH_3D7) TaxID=1276538 RepID=A0A1X7RT31_ZYMT9|nr:unnamed protein product [Zymoseptoria tritici ST99CH_3D7]
MPNNHEIRLMMNDPPWLPLAISFHFLDLPPEIRNLVYYELLTLPEASSVRGCHPQILATSKQMHSEAKKLLFLLNYIPIRILPGGVFIGNLRCGDYAPSLRSNKKGVIPGSSQNDLRHLVWPEFLRTAPFIRFEGGGTVDCSAKTHIDDEWQQAFNRSGSDRLLPYQYEMFISNVLWLLSAELHKERMCRLLKGTWRRHDTFLSHPGYGLELYPSVVNGTQFSYNPRPVDVDMRSMAKDVQAGKTMTIAAVLASCLTLLWRVYAAHPALGMVTSIPCVLAFIVDWLFRWYFFATSRVQTGHLASFLAHYTFELRTALGSVDVQALSHDVIARANRMLHLQIEIEIATRREELKGIDLLDPAELERMRRRMRAL